MDSDEPQSYTPAAPVKPPKTGFRLPADYYAAPATEGRRLFPRWVPFGCGTASIVVLVVLFGFGAFLSRGGVGRVLDLLFGQMQSEMTAKFASDVTPAQKVSFSAEMTQLRANLRADRIKLPAVQPLLAEMRDGVADGTLTRAEVEHLTGQLHRVNHPPAPGISK